MITPRIKTAWHTLLTAIIAYIIGAALSAAVVIFFSPNRHDRSVEAVMTGVFFVDSLVAIIAVAIFLGYKLLQ
jgi:ABC-type spermidine/putrescine transport system permease subunit I